MMKKIGLFIIISIILISCEKLSFSKVKKEGVIQKQGITSYRYGTHVLNGDKDFYALRSDEIDLDQYVGKKVTIKGNKIDGYPVSGGPDYIEVVIVVEK